jgi:hypothetical protein
MPQSRRFHEPHGQAPTLAQGDVIGGPIRHSVQLLWDVMTAILVRFEWHGDNPGSGAGPRSYTVHSSPPNDRSVQQGRQSAVTTGFPLSAIPRKPSPGKLAAAPNPHRRSTPHRFPTGSFFGGFRTPAYYRVHRSRRAGIRNPSRKQAFAGRAMNGEVRPIADIQRHRLRRYGPARTLTCPPCRPRVMRTHLQGAL